VKVDHNEFRQRFAELSHEELLSINRDELIDVARHWYDLEIARRELQHERHTREEAPAAFPKPVKVLDTVTISSSPRREPGFFGAALDLLRHFLTATLGTAIVESSVYGIYHTTTRAGATAKEITISAVVAFGLGVVVQRIRPSNMAKWMALLGVLTFATTLRFEQPTSVLERSGFFHLAPVFDPDDPAKLTSWFVSVRLLAYSLGAFCCATFASKKAGQVQPHSERSQTAWCPGDPPPDGGREAERNA
jgi:hypothetical protein